MNQRLVYLDHAATTPMRDEAVEAMLPFLSGTYANPSGSHRFAREARRAIDEARDVVAAVIGCQPGEVVFNGGGTEGDNTAIRGAVERRGGVAVCPAAEHHAVLHCVEHEKGVVVGVDSTGAVDLEALERVLRETSNVSVVAVMAVNNETGTITDMRAVSRLVRSVAPGALIHTDAVQAACWLDLRTIWPLVDTMALSAHKFGGPKGVGVLAVRSGSDVAPLILGGGQERDRRSGTHNVAGIVSLACALDLTDRQREHESRRLLALRERLVDGVRTRGDVHRTVPPEHSVPGVAHVCIADVESEALLYLLDEAGVCASAASACASGAMEPSHVLAAMGIGRRLASGALRMSLGHSTTDDDVDVAVDVVGRSIDRLRSATKKH